MADSALDPPPRPRRRRGGRTLRAFLIGTVLLVAAAVAAVAAVGFGGVDPPDAPARSTLPAATAQVARQTLVEQANVPGEIGYGAAAPLRSTASGTVTWLPPVGSTVGRGEPVLRVDDQPVVLLFGALPLYRPLGTKTKGRDVAQFERNLRALGYPGFTVDEEFTTATEASVKRWQKDLEVPETGVVDASRVIYAPSALRIAAHTVRVGASATGDVLTYTGSTKIVTATVGAGKAGWVKHGAKVSVVLPDGKATAGTVATAETAAAQSGTDNPGGDAETEEATTTVTVDVADQKALAAFDSAPVEIRYVIQERRDVLTVPVTALLALAEGGYGLEVVQGGQTRIVPVETGLFADGQVEVRGAGIDAGVTVRTPE